VLCFGIDNILVLLISIIVISFDIENCIVFWYRLYRSSLISIIVMGIEIDNCVVFIDTDKLCCASISMFMIGFDTDKLRSASIP
jgi:hypothetical protein